MQEPEINQLSPRYGSKGQKWFLTYPLIQVSQKEDLISIVKIKIININERKNVELRSTVFT